MGLLFINIVLALLWSALTGQFALENLITGFVLGYIVLYLMRGVFGGGQYFEKGAQVVRFILFFTWELLVANIRVARDVLRPGPLRLQPRVIAVRVDLQGAVPLTLLANVLSLTPGTLSLDISDDKETLFVHAINSPDEEATVLEIKNGFERLVSDLFSQKTPDQEKPITEEPEP